MLHGHAFTKHDNQANCFNHLAKKINDHLRIDETLCQQNRKS